jgi:hypothetical protein
MKKRVGIGRRVWADGGAVEDGGSGLPNSARPFVGVLYTALKCMFLLKLSFLQVEFWLNAKAIILKIHM